MNNNQIDICKELGQNFIDFSYEANSCRAFADARDGLKPGQRACLWEMYSKGYKSNKPHVKSAKIAGGVTGTWWPHGDVAIYDTFTRMSQPWINNNPEVDWHGNNGSQIIPDSAAASRYTEARLSKIVEDGMFQGIKKNNVNMIKNYSEDDEWPEVLPAIFPRLLVNGCQGIGSTIANVWLPYNFKEVAQTLIEYMTTGKLNFSNLYPDFPTGCTIINKNDNHIIHETGKGKVILIARYEVKNKNLIFKELPYQVYIEPLIDKIKELVSKGEITGVEDIQNTSGKDGISITVECSEDPESVAKQLYRKTDLKKSYNANQWALIGKTPKLLTLKDYCEVYLNHNLECITRELNYDLKEAKDRAEVVDGLLKALVDIDNIIALIRNSSDKEEAKEKLIKLNFTVRQAKAILAMQLASLTKLDNIELNKEAKELDTKIKGLLEILESRDKKISLIRERLETLIKKYGKPRKTEIAQLDGLVKEEKEVEEIIPEDVVVITTKSGLIKRIPKANFKPQNRAGKGVKTNNDVIFEPISTNTVDSLMIFTDKGKMYKVSVDSIPEGTNASKGQSIYMLTKIDPSEKIAAITSLHKDTNAEFVLFFTKNGLIKKTRLDEYCQIKKSTGIQAIKIKENDAIAEVTFIKDEPIMIITKNGMCLRTKSTDISATGRVTIGVKGIKLNDGDEVIAGLPINNNKTHLLAVAKDGTGKRIPLEEYSEQMKGGKGVYVCSSKTILAGAALVNDNSEILLIGSPNSLVLKAKDITISSKASVGVILIKGSTVSSVIKL